MGKEFKYNGIIYDSNNCLDYMRENGVDAGLLTVAQRKLQHDEYVKLLADCLRTNIIDTDFFMLNDYIEEETIVRQILSSSIRQLKNSTESNKEDIFRTQLSRLCEKKSKSNLSEEQITRFNNFINFIYNAYQNGRRPDETMIVEDKVIGIDGVINWALEKSGYTFLGNNDFEKKQQKKLEKPNNNMDYLQDLFIG